MAVTVKTAAAAAQKFITNAQAAAPAYATGVANSRMESGRQILQLPRTPGSRAL